MNLWIENAVLLYDNAEDCKDNQFEINDELFVEMYIYGLVSQALSLISLSKNSHLMRCTRASLLTQVRMSGNCIKISPYYIF